MKIDTSFNEPIINKENEINQENEYKNPRWCSKNRNKK